MQGVPVTFTHQHDRADFRALPGQPATELYRAHIQHHIFDPHSHEGFGLGVIECVPSVSAIAAASSWQAPAAWC
ncbi:hypothetical protein ACSZMQ_01130 [Aeromonas rivipollensis]